MMMHITDSPIPLPELLAHMKPGDIVTHCYHGRAHGIMGQEKNPAPTPTSPCSNCATEPSLCETPTAIPSTPNAGWLISSRSRTDVSGTNGRANNPAN